MDLAVFHFVSETFKFNFSKVNGFFYEFYFLWPIITLCLSLKFFSYLSIYEEQDYNLLKFKKYHIYYFIYYFYLWLKVLVIFYKYKNKNVYNTQL